MTHTRLLIPAVVAAGAAAVIGLSAAQAGAAPLRVDPGVPANGAPAPGISRGPLITPPESPIQVPAPTVTREGSITSYRSYPFFAPWFHDAVPVPGGTGLDAAGGIRLRVVNPATRAQTTVEIAGHCLFVGDGVAADTGADPASAPGVRTSVLPPIRIDTPALQISIDPTIFAR